MEEEDWQRIEAFISATIKTSLAEESKLITAAMEKHARGPDHLALKAMIERENAEAVREKQRQLRWEQIRATVVGGAILSMLMWFGINAVHFAGWVWSQFQHSSQ